MYTTTTNTISYIIILYCNHNKVFWFPGAEKSQLLPILHIAFKVLKGTVVLVREGFKKKHGLFHYKAGALISLKKPQRNPKMENFIIFFKPSLQFLFLLILLSVYKVGLWWMEIGLISILDCLYCCQRVIYQLGHKHDQG